MTFQNKIIPNFHLSPATMLTRISLPLVLQGDIKAKFTKDIPVNEIQRLNKSPRMSQAVRANGMVFLSGQVATDLNGSIEQQTAEVLAGIESLLCQAGSNKSLLISINIWLSDIADFDRMNAVYEQWLNNSAQPARACVQSALADPGYRIEAQAMALSQASD